MHSTVKKGSMVMSNFEFGETMKKRTKALEYSSLRSAPPNVDRLITEGTVKWDTLGCGASIFGVRGQAKRDPALARWARTSSTVKAPSPLRFAGALLQEGPSAT